MEVGMEIGMRFLVLPAVLVLLPGLTVAQEAPGKSAPSPSVKVVELDPGDSPYQELLTGPPETASLRSGLVTLAPGTSVGKHNTENFEEMLMPLEGEGELRLPGRPAVRIRPGVIAYAPVHTEHDVVNTGTKRLRYIFIVAEVR
jgi:quercetin dioxygenase-like cupin family protein